MVLFLVVSAFFLSFSWLFFFIILDLLFFPFSCTFSCFWNVFVVTFFLFLIFSYFAIIVVFKIFVVSVIFLSGSNFLFFMVVSSFFMMMMNLMMVFFNVVMVVLFINFMMVMVIVDMFMVSNWLSSDNNFSIITLMVLNWCYRGEVNSSVLRLLGLYLFWWRWCLLNLLLLSRGCSRGTLLG